MADRKLSKSVFPDPFVAPREGPAVAGFGVRAPELLGAFHAANRAQMKAVATPVRATPPRKAPLRVFVGGGFDNVFGGNMQSYYERYLDTEAGPAEYYTHLSVPSIVGAIRRANEEGVPVDIVGHSYGGMAAFNAANLAGQEGYKVRNLVTVDPVGRLSTSDGPPPAGRVSRWVNINAEPPHDAFVNPAYLSDVVAWVGGKPSAVPTSYADSDFTVRRHHQDLAGMIRDAGVDTLLSAGSGPEALSDDLDGREWNRRRTAQVQGATRRSGPR